MRRLKRLIWSPLGRAGMVTGMLMLGTLLYLKFTGYLAPYLSPGPVSASTGSGKVIEGFHSHAEFELECLHCHEPVHCLSASRCQKCHLDVARQQAEVEGVHGLLPGTDRCHTCHNEHEGRDAELTRVPFVNIDHQVIAGFSLDHHQEDFDGQPLDCDSCHKEHRFAVQDMDCLACHAEGDAMFMAEHGERFGGECMICHDGVDRMRDFNHNEVFVREGEHADLDCEDCHVDRTFAGTSNECASCHEEPTLHAGHFGVDCARCHAPTGWRPAQLTEHAFALEHGEEGQLACESCHVTSYTAYTCVGCHEDNEMQTTHPEETLVADGRVVMLDDCSMCHPTGQVNEDWVRIDDGDSAGY